MKHRGKTYNALRWIAALLLSFGAITQVHAQAQSLNVAYIQSQNVYNGGSFPFTSNPAFAAFNFYQLPYNSPNYAAALAAGGVCGASACDTVLLNVASYTPFYCNVNGLLSAQAKTGLVNFVNNGGKLIIYDSECRSQDYGWLPYPFTTSNPGAMGARGTVNIVEDNGLSTKEFDPTCTSGDPLCINAYTLGNNTDAVGDMNVMTSFDPNWCLDMSGTNVLNVTGPTHTYARYGDGLIIYNGFDVDVMRTSTVPTNTVPAGNLAKIWLQELQVEFNPTPRATLPCGVAVVGITQAPLTAVNDLALGQNSHTVTATLKDQTGVPEVGVTVTFTVVSGPNAGASGTCSVNANCTSDANGQVSFTYASNGTLGTDTIDACFVNAQQQTVCAQQAKKDWIQSQQAICDVDGDGDVDRLDLSLISRSRGQLAQPGGDPRDANGDGVITPADVKACIPLCTLPGCAVQ